MAGGRLPRLEDCDCYTEINRRGQYVGRVRQFPDLRTRPQAKGLDAITEVHALLADKLIQLNAESERLADGTWPVAGLGGA